MAYNSFQSYVRKNPGTALAATIMGLSALGNAALFTIKDSSGNDVFQCFGTGCTLSQPLTVNGVNVGSGALNYPAFPLTGSGVSTATGTNVFGDIVAPYAFTLRTVNARISEVADNNATTVTVLKNGKTVLSTNAIIDATEKDTSTGTAGVVNSASGSFVAGDILTFNVQSPATTPGKDLKVRLSLLQTSFP